MASYFYLTARLINSTTNCQKVLLITIYELTVTNPNPGTYPATNTTLVLNPDIVTNPDPMPNNYIKSDSYPCLLYRRAGAGAVAASNYSPGAGAA
jgi:hypothetical protein